MPSPDEFDKETDSEVTDNLVSTYAAELEVEVDRLRIREEIVRNEANEFLSLLSLLTASGTDLAEGRAARTKISEAMQAFRELLQHLNDQAGPAPERDDVATIDLQSLIEQVFNTEQRVHRASDVVLHLSLQSETILWFPNRLRHILHNLIGNALRFREPTKGETRVSVAAKAADGQFELRVSDNGTGISAALATSLVNLPHRAAEKRPMHSSLGLAVVQSLVNQCCGSVKLQSDEHQGTSIVVHLPRYATGDFLESSGD